MGGSWVNRCEFDPSGTLTPRVLPFAIDALPEDPVELVGQLAEIVEGGAFQDAFGSLTRTVGFLASTLFNTFLSLLFAFFLLRENERLTAWFHANIADEDSDVAQYFAAVDEGFESVYFGYTLTIFVVIIIAAVVTAYLVLVALQTNPSALWFPLLFVVVMELPFDNLVRIYIRPALSGRLFPMGLIVFAYLVGPPLFGWHGIFYGPFLMVVVVRFLRLKFPRMLHPGDEENPLKPVESASDWRFDEDQTLLDDVRPDVDEPTETSDRVGDIGRIERTEDLLGDDRNNPNICGRELLMTRCLYRGMSVILEFSIAAEDFELGSVLMGPPTMRHELERVVPTGNMILPFVWVTGEDHDAFEETVRQSPRVRELLRLDSIDDSVLYRIDWNNEPTNLIESISAADATVLEARGDSDWVFRLRFPDHDALSDFHDDVVERDIPIHVERTFTLADEERHGYRFNLTSEQREALVLALRRGYFETPSRVGLDELADELDISRQALSHRIRLGNEKVLRSTLLSTEANHS